MEKTDLEKLKETYTKLQIKHSLPNFEQMNEDFGIDRIAEIKTEILIREVRKFMTEKFSNYLRFIEAILNPVNSPIFVFSVIKNLNNREKEILTEVYKKLAKFEIELLEIDLQFSEENEAEFIKRAFREWQ